MKTNKRPANFCQKTNFEAEVSGIAPELPDGSIVNLHHVNQNAFGPLAEVSSCIHSRSNKNAFDHRVFKSDRVDYWKSMAAKIKSKLNNNNKILENWSLIKLLYNVKHCVYIRIINNESFIQTILLVFYEF